MVLECLRPRQAMQGGESGTGTSLGKAYFRTAWARIRAELTDADIATAHRYAEASAEALARYQNRQK